MLIWVDENGYVKYGPAFNIYFSCIVLTYLFVPSIIGFYYLTLGRNRLPADGEISITMFVFSGMTPVIYFLQLALVDSKHTTTSVAVTLALLYLITNESTHRVLDTQAKVEAVETELRIASKIQTDTLPPEAPEFVGYTNLNLRGSMITAKEVGGDFYDYFPIDNNRLCFLIADVSGKSTPAALFMMTTKTMIKDYALTKGSTSEIFTAVNSRLCENNKEGMFVTAWIGIIDTKTMTLQYTNAGHNYPYILREGQPCEIIKKNHGLFLGGMEFTQYKQGEIQLESGDRLLLYTDGVVEAHDCSGGLYGSERLERILNSTRDCTGEEVLKRVLNDVNDFAAGVPQFDDITMIIMTVK
jgi:serine phosphatase RsbU (regulator of sigma subunit)